ncbi:unnamed protein product [Mesocestoides corti]|uniref:Cytochrome b n=1 Tax=Mesocestoides corti TaxID=53468 RepID=A0A0R3UDB2_MESCO|nr:unnamed protein product [Mesocestoides corti]
MNKFMVNIIRRKLIDFGFMISSFMVFQVFTGVILSFLYVADSGLSFYCAFMGYILPLPVIGSVLYSYIVGGFSVTKVTLVRVFSAHVCVGFVILGLMVIHLFYLHRTGSKNPLFVSNGYGDVVYFHSYFTVKDFMCLMFVCLFIIFCLFYIPEYILDVESYLEADSLETPVTIKPEWYFLIFYAILRCIDSKLGGLALILVLLFLLLFIRLTYLGGCHPEYPYLFICKVFSVFLVTFMFLFKLFWRYDNYIL